MLDDLYQAGAEAAVNDLIARPPQTPQPQASKFSAWKTLTAAPRGVATGANETAGGIADVLGAFGQTMAATDARPGMFSAQTPEQRKQETQARRQMLDEGLQFNEGDDFRARARQWLPDPTTSHVAEQTVFGLTRFGTKAVAGAAVAGPVAGAGLVGLDEALTTADDLKQQGVDPLTRSKVGAVVGLTSAMGVALPVAGNTGLQTAALVAAGGPLSFMGQQAATREILQAADYTKLADQYDPLDPVGLAVSTIVPAGFGLWAMRGAKIRAQAQAEGATSGFRPENEASPARQANAEAQDGEPVRPTPEQVDAARVEMLTQHMEDSRFIPGGDILASRAHDEAVLLAMEQIASGRRVEVDGVAPKVPDTIGVDPVRAAAREIAAAIERAKDDDPFSEYALRVIPGDFDGDIRQGDSLPPSKQWNDGIPTEEDLPGTSAARIASDDEESILNTLKVLGADGEDGPNGYYHGQRVVLIRGDSAGFGEDVGEILISNAEVVDVWNKSAPGKAKILPNSNESKSADKLADFAARLGAALNDLQEAHALAQRMVKEPLPNGQDAPQARTGAAPAGRADAQTSPAPAQPGAQPARPDAGGPGQSGAGEQGGAGVSGARGGTAEAGLVAQRLAEVQAQFPDLTVQMDGMDKPMPLADFLAEVQREAMEGSDFDLGGNDAPLMQVAATCFLLNG